MFKLNKVFTLSPSNLYFRNETGLGRQLGALELISVYHNPKFQALNPTDSNYRLGVWLGEWPFQYSANFIHKKMQTQYLIWQGEAIFQKSLLKK